MTCPACGRESPEHAPFCSFCGAPLHESQPSGSGPEPPEEEGDSAGTPPGDGDVERQVQFLRSTVGDLRDALSSISQRVAALEQGRAPPTSAPPQEAGGRTGAPRPPAGRPIRTAPGAGRPARPLQEAVERLFSEWGWEWLLGGNWLARVGVVALVIGVGFFLKLAIDNQWLDETGQVVLGLVGGLALLAAGEFWQRRYPVWAQALTGGGLAILYLSTFAAFSLYGLVPSLPAFGIFALTTLAAAALALRYESMAIAILAIIGGFVTPVLLGQQLPDQRLLLAYVLVLDLGVLGLATFRSWRWFTLLALLGSLGLYWFWWAELGPGLLLAQLGITLVFLIFAGATTLFHVLWQRTAGPLDYALMVLNAAAYFGISYGLMFQELRPWMGGFTLLLALFYGLLAYLVHQRGESQRNLSLFAAGIGLVFLTIAAPVQFQGPWTSIAWSAEAVVLMWLSFRLGLPEFRASSLALLALLTLWLLLEQTPRWDADALLPVINYRFLGFASGIAAMYLAAWFLWRWRDRPRAEWEVSIKEAYLPSLLVTANLLLVWALSFEVVASVDSGYFEVPARSAANVVSLSLSILWAVYAAVLVVLGIVKHWRWVRLGGLALLTIPVAKLFVYDIFALERGFRVAAFLGLGGVLIAGGFLYQRYRGAFRGFLMD